jgi:outer membrane protein assembly factor BamA
MKKLYVLFFTVLICSITQAQIKKGEIVLGGNLGYSDQSYTTDIPGANSSSNSNKTLFISTSFGKAIKDNLVLGADISYNHSNSSYTPGSATTGNGFGAGVFLRKYKHLGEGF